MLSSLNLKCRFSPQLILGHGVRRLHVSAALSAKAKVSMSRFEPNSYVNYEKLQSNVNIVRKRSACSTHACSSRSCLFVFPLLSTLVCFSVALSVDFFPAHWFPICPRYLILIMMSGINIDNLIMGGKDMYTYI